MDFVKGISELGPYLMFGSCDTSFGMVSAKRDVAHVFLRFHIFIF